MIVPVEVAAVVFTALVLYIGVKVVFQKTNPNEPPSVTPKVPIIGHLLGFAENGMSYYQKLGNTLPDIFSINLIFFKPYVVTSDHLLSLIQRNSRSINIDVLFDMSTKRMAGFSNADYNAFIKPNEQGVALCPKVIKSMATSLRSECVSAMNKRMLSYLMDSLDSLSGETEPVDLDKWMRHVLTTASTDAVWGPRNPFRDPEVEEAFWYFEMRILSIVHGFFPHIFNRKVIQARQKCAQAFVKYFETKTPTLDEASELACERARLHIEAGISLLGLGQAETAMSFGLLSNTVATAFWMIFDIYSRPDLLDNIRNELEKHAVKVDGSKNSRCLSLQEIRENCLLFSSTLQEVMRLRGRAPLMRGVTQNVALENYHLKAGSMIQFPGALFHYSKDTWGEDVEEFNPHRFLDLMKNEKKDAQQQRKMKNWLAFGISPWVCPGRHFACSEIALLVALLVLRFDIEPEDGAWIEPPLEKMTISSLDRPEKSPMVRFTKREEYKNDLWIVQLDEEKQKFPLMSG